MRVIHTKFKKYENFAWTLTLPLTVNIALSLAGLNFISCSIHRGGMSWGIGNSCIKYGGVDGACSSRHAPSGWQYKRYSTVQLRLCVQTKPSVKRLGGELNIFKRSLEFSFVIGERSRRKRAWSIGQCLRPSTTCFRSISELLDVVLAVASHARFELVWTCLNLLRSSSSRDILEGVVCTHWLVLDLAGRLAKAYIAYSHQENSTRPTGNSPTYLFRKADKFFLLLASGSRIGWSICWCIEFVWLANFWQSRDRDAHYLYASTSVSNPFSLLCCLCWTETENNEAGERSPFCVEGHIGGLVS